MMQRDAEAAEDRLVAASRWRRGYFQLRASFVQEIDETRSDRRGPLAGFVHDRQHRSLLLFLMLLSVWPWQHDAKAPLEAYAWMNLLHYRGNDFGRSLVWSDSTLSRSWKYLAKRQLITKKRGRFGRLDVRPSMENGNSDPYTFPTGEKKNRAESYFTIPDRFWLEGDFARLGLPGLAMLLIIARETNGKKTEIRLTQDQFAEYYGISRATVSTGLAELRALGLLEERIEWIPAPLSKIRTTSTTYYSLRGEYSTSARATARAKAERRRKRTAGQGQSGSRPAFSTQQQEGGERNDSPGVSEVESDS